jgi:predicted transglutaminase-like cysteine proteinase
MPTNKTKSLFASIALALAIFASPAGAAQNVAFANVSLQTTSIPVGAAQFCAGHQRECGVNPDPVATMTLTEERWAELLAANSQMNTSITPVTDEDLYQVAEYWTYPDNGYGDCEDIALAKRRDLIARGWAPSTLLMAVVRQTNGEGHAVLMVRTDRGDLVLDNQDAMIRVWTDSPYHFLKRQSQANSAQWVDIVDDRPIVVAAVQ